MTQEGLCHGLKVGGNNDSQRDVEFHAFQKMKTLKYPISPTVRGKIKAEKRRWPLKDICLSKGLKIGQNRLSNFTFLERENPKIMNCVETFPRQSSSWLHKEG